MCDFFRLQLRQISHEYFYMHAHIPDKQQNEKSNNVGKSIGR